MDDFKKILQDELPRVAACIRKEERDAGRDISDEAALVVARKYIVDDYIICAK